MTTSKTNDICCALAASLLFIILITGWGCDFDMGGDPVGGDNNDEEDTQCTAEVVERVSIESNGSQADGNSHSPSISENGRFVAFISAATDLVLDDTNEAEDVFVHDRSNGLTQQVSIASDGSEADDESVTASLSANGSFVAF